jgi:hypothetical protein
MHKAEPKIKRVTCVSEKYVPVNLGCLTEGPMINWKEEYAHFHLLAGTSDIL